MGNIVVKKADGTTDVTYFGVAMSGGDNIPAIYRNTVTGPTLDTQAVCSVVGKQSGNRRENRRVTIQTLYPYVVTDTNTGITRKVRDIPVKTEIMLAGDIPQSVIDEAAAQHANLVKSLPLQASLKSGYAPVA